MLEIDFSWDLLLRGPLIILVILSSLLSYILTSWSAAHANKLPSLLHSIHMDPKSDENTSLFNISQVHPFSESLIKSLW